LAQQRAAFGEQRADRREQEVAVRADPATEHDERDVRHRGDRDDVLRDPAGLLVATAHASSSFARAARKIARASNGGVVDAIRTWFWPPRT
jgi:hypothetical protein